MGTPFQILCEQNYFSKGQLVITDKSHLSGLDLIKKMDWTLRWQSTIKTNRKYIHSIK